MSRAHYHLDIADDIIALVDNSAARGGLSITNAADEIIADLFTLLGDDLNGKRIVYRDSMGCWDGLAHRGGAFLDFVMIRAKDRNEAIRLARAMTDWPT